MPGDQQFSVDPGQLEACRATLDRIRLRAAALVTLAVEADPEWYIWGELGKPFAAAYWQGCAQDLYSQLAHMTVALEGRVEALGATCAAYQSTDRKIAEALHELRALLGDES